MIYNKKEFGLGLTMLIGFFVVLAIFFMPVFNGHNGLNYLDNLYNSISKGSAYYIPGLQPGVDEFKGHQIDVVLDLESAQQAEQAIPLFEAAGATVSADGKQLSVQGGLGMILSAALADSDLMYANDGPAMQAKYGYDPQQALYNWWASLKALDKSLTKEKDFKAAKEVSHIQTKAVEAAYNYYGIEAQSITDRMGMVIFSLAFYVIYTLWYGFAILFMFEGWGLKLSH